MLRELEPKLTELDLQIATAKAANTAADNLLQQQLEDTKNTLLRHAWGNLSSGDRVYLARHPQRPTAQQYIQHLFENFFVQAGDRLSGEDESIIGGMGTFHGMPVTVLAQCKGKTLEENLQRNFGMPSPEGYRKVQRLAAQAEKFGRPIITLIDTPGAYPGLAAEEHGQGEAIARCLAQFSALEVPVIAVIIGEGGSGGALALGVANSIIMLENSIYSILSPEGFATILWKDATRSAEACEMMKLTAQDLYQSGIVDHIVEEGVGAAHTNTQMVLSYLDKLLYTELTRLQKSSGPILAKERYRKFRKMGDCIEIKEKR